MPTGAGIDVESAFDLIEVALEEVCGYRSREIFIGDGRDINAIVALVEEEVGEGGGAANVEDVGVDAGVDVQLIDFVVVDA